MGAKKKDCKDVLRHGNASTGKKNVDMKTACFRVEIKTGLTQGPFNFVLLWIMSNDRDTLSNEQLEVNI